MSQTPKASLYLTEQEEKFLRGAQVRLAQGNVMMNRSDILRLGLMSLSQLSDQALLDLAAGANRLKPGRKPAV